MFQLACPNCRKLLRVGEEHAGKRLQCPHCKKPFSIRLNAAAPAKESPPSASLPIATFAPPEPTPSAWRNRFGSDTVLAMSGMAWLVLVLAIPSMQTMIVSLVATFALLTASFAISVGTLIVRQRILVLLNIVQFGLFALLSCQIYATLGPDHYRFAREPRWWDWIHYTFAHVIRAADLLDVLVSYGIELHNVKHQSKLTGILLVWLQLAVDLVLFAVIVRLQGIPLKTPAYPKKTRFQAPQASLFKKLLNVPFLLAVSVKKRLADAREQWKKSRRACLILCLTIVIATAFSQGWPIRDWILWPLDNLLRLLDFVGMFDIFDWTLHGVPMGFWTRTVGLVFRLMCGICLLEWFFYLNVRFLGGDGRTIESYIPDLDSADKETRDLASRALADIGRKAITELVAALGSPNARIVNGAFEALQRLDPSWPATPEARAAVPLLVAKLQGFEDPDGEGHKNAARALGLLGPNAREALSPLVYGLANDVTNSGEQFRKALARIDPLWAESPEAEEAVMGLILLLQNDANALDREKAAEAIGEMGAAGRAAIAALCAAMASGEDNLRRASAKALGRMGAQAAAAVPMLIQRLRNAPAHELFHIVELLGQIGPSARAAVPVLLDLLANPYLRDPAREALRRIDPSLLERLSAPQQG